MYAKSLKCARCGKKYPLSLYYTCDECNGILMVNYDYDEMKKKLDFRIFSQPRESLWHYRELLPICDHKNVVSMKEGLTPIIKNLNNLKNKYNLENVYIKDETRNPTASFKDRPTTVGISKSLELGYKNVAIASTGNAAASVAGYAAKAKMESYIFIPEDTPEGKIEQTLTYGANIIKVKGVFSNSYKLALEACKRYNWANLTSTYLNPYTLEGDKTVAYEIYFQLGGRIPDYVIVPIGAGPLLYGIFKGFKELKTLSLCSKIPSMIGVQAENCSPIVNAFEQKQNNVVSQMGQPTIASGIDDPLIGYEQDGTMTLDAIYQTNGLAVKVNEKEIIESVYELGNEEGVFAEPAAAASWAGYKKLININRIKKIDKVLLMVTGHGLKKPITKHFYTKEIPVIKSIGELEKIIKH